MALPVEEKADVTPGIAPVEAHNIADLRQHAQRVLPRGLFEFVDRGTEDEAAMRANRDGFERIRFRPHVLNNVSARTLGTSLFGQPSAMARRRFAGMSPGIGGR